MAKPTTVSPALIELMARRERKIKAEAARPKAPVKAPPKPAVAQDHTPPVIGAKEVMAGFPAAMAIVRERRLQALARKFPEVALLLDSVEAQKPAQSTKPPEPDKPTPADAESAKSPVPEKSPEIPKVENPDEHKDEPPAV